MKALKYLIAGMFCLFMAEVFAHEIAEIVLEEPVDSGTSSGIGNIRGWVISDSGVERVELFVNGQYQADIPFGGQRTDVESAYPNVPNSINSGFGQTFNFGELGYGQHQITVRAYLGDGLLIEDTASFKASVLPEPFFPEREKPDLSGASVSLDRTTGKIRISEVELSSGETLDLLLEWSTPTQGFSLVDVTDSEADEIPSGAVVFKDGNGMVLGEAKSHGSDSYLEVDGFIGSFYNNDNYRHVRFSGTSTSYKLYFETTDCSGDPHVSQYNEQVNDIDGELFVADKSAQPQQRLFSSWKSSAAARFSWGEMEEYETCHEGQTAQEALPTVKYTPPPRILNAAYPVTLEQAP
jgi:hypothetical protein